MCGVDSTGTLAGTHGEHLQTQVERRLHQRHRVRMIARCLSLHFADVHSNLVDLEYVLHVLEFNCEKTAFL